MYEDTNKKLEEAKKETDILKSVAETRAKELEEARQASAAAAENTGKAQVGVMWGCMGLSCDTGKAQVGSCGAAWVYHVTLAKLRWGHVGLHGSIM